MDLLHLVWFSLDAIVLTLALCASALTSAKVFGHKLLLGRIRPSSIRNLRYSFSDTFISVSSIHIAFHIPCPSNPRLATFIAYDYKYEDAGCCTSISEIRTILWFFPVLFRFTRGSWLSVELHDFKLRVFTTRVTPGWVQKLRRNLISAILTGELLRLDHFKTTLLLSSLTGAANGSSAQVEKPGMGNGEPQDEIRVTGYCEGYQTRNWQQRVYTFEKMQAQLRRSWIESRGSFVLIAEGSTWTRVPTASHQPTVPFWWQLAKSIFYFPLEICKICIDPLSAIDLYLPRTDVTFDDFRIRDAELLRQGGMMLKAHWDASGHIYHAHLWDNFIKAILALGT